MTWDLEREATKAGLKINTNVIQVSSLTAHRTLSICRANFCAHAWQPVFFGGDISQCESFKGVFNSVYEDSDIGWVERSMMLRNRLWDDAKRLIEPLGVYGNNYSKA